jgi:hypothetical protein
MLIREALDLKEQWIHSGNLNAQQSGRSIMNVIALAIYAMFIVNVML